MKRKLLSLFIATAVLASVGFVSAEDLTLEIPAGDGAGQGKHIVLISGDEEYRSEETNPMLAKILSVHHGFKTTVLFAIDPETGVINPEHNSNIPGLEALKKADLVILNTRFRNLPDEQLQHFADYINSGKPLIGIRTATHAFNTKNTTANFDWNNFGLLYLGEKWVAHHGKHKVEGTRGVIEEAHQQHPVLNSVADIFGPTDVYTVKNLDESKATVLVRGAITENMEPESKILADDKRNNPTQALIWLHDYTAPNGTAGKSLTTTIGASVDFKSEDLRRAVVNGVYHLLNLEVPKKADVSYVDPFQPTFYARNPKDYYTERKLKPSDFALGKSPSTGLASTKKPNPGINYGQAQKDAESQRPVHTQPGKPEAPAQPVSLPYTPVKGERIVMIGNSLGERMLWDGYFEAEIFSRFPNAELYFRNMCHPGDTPGFRAHPARKTQWAFPGAEAFHQDKLTHFGIGHYPYPDEWLAELKADTLIAFFGFNESFDGLERLDNFRDELSAFVDHTLAQAYNGQTAPRLILVTPISFQDRTDTYDLPDGSEENKRLAAYAQVVTEVAIAKQVGTVDLFTPTSAWFREDPQAEGRALTLNGSHLSEWGNAKLAPYLATAIFGPRDSEIAHLDALRAAIIDRNWIWHHDYRMLNGVHVWGQRWAPYGNFNYPEEIEKIRQMGHLRDQKIWAVAQGKPLDIDDSSTRPLSPVTTNFDRDPNYLDTTRARSFFHLPEGYRISLFASEERFPNLENPVQMSFDARGRLWVSTLPSYPHYKPGAEKPNDKILVYEDTDGDGVADKETVFADGLHLPIGFELAPEGVYVSEEPYLLLLEDRDGDGVANHTTRLLDGFDSHDTHHAISAYTADASGALYMSEGRFLHSQVETPYGPQRMTDGGLWRFDPHSWKLIRYSQSDYNNPWATMFDDYGQAFLSDASSGANWYLLPLSIKVPHGKEVGHTSQFTTHQVRPTSGGEFISSRHFPAEVQGHYLINNTIGFLGTKQHSMTEDGSGFTGSHVQDLLRSDDGNFRPVDLEFGPDGSLYLVDWHNALIGHMQHSARDPKRNGGKGRIYRITYPENELVEPAKIEGESPDHLAALLGAHEYRTRYRARRELRGHRPEAAISAVKHWIQQQDKSAPLYGRHLLEALWATWAQHRVDTALLEEALAHPDHRVRSGGVNVVRFHVDKLAQAPTYLMTAARDEHPRVRLEAIAAASWMDNPDGAKILLEAVLKPIDRYMGHAVIAAWWTLGAHAQGIDISQNPIALQLAAGTYLAKVPVEDRPELPKHLSEADQKLWKIGELNYHKDGYCITCHGLNGQGTVPNIYPPLVDSEWVTGDVDRLIKLTLHGLWGPIEVKGKRYDPDKGVPPMTAFGSMLNDEEIAGVLTYIRHAWGNKASPVQAETVAKVRAATADRTPGLFYKPEELLKEHPMKKP